MLKKIQSIITLGLALFLASCDGVQKKTPNKMKEKRSSSRKIVEDIKAYCIDLNWEKVGHRGKVARLGAFAKTNPADHFAWYKMMGVNVIQTFCVSLNGYAWYKNGVVPEQPGLKYDYLPEMVRMGHEAGMKVFGYYTIGYNPRWAKLRPDLNYTTDDIGGLGGGYHIVYTDEYLEFLAEGISDAVRKTGIDGFMIDWLWQPTRKASKGRWIEAEKQLYEQLMGVPYPGDEKLTYAEEQAYGRVALTRTWRAIQKAAKDVNPDCKVWLTVNKMDHPHVLNSEIYQEVDWLMNEAGDMRRIRQVVDKIGDHTRLITCMAAWTGVNATEVVPMALNEGVGLYGFSDPKAKSVKHLAELLAKPVWGLKGDARNIATLARAYHGVDINTVRNSSGEWVLDNRSDQQPEKEVVEKVHRPNVVVITADDLPWTDTEMMGSNYAFTPNLKKLAESGAFFPRAYVPTPWSRASLATLLTGHYANQHGITTDDTVEWSGGSRGMIAPTHSIERLGTMPKLLRKAGYVSFQSGRWFEGEAKAAGFTHGSSRKGDHGYDHHGIGETHLQACKDFIAEAQSKEAPFFLWYAPALPAFNYNARAQKLPEHPKVPHELMMKQRFILGNGMNDEYYQFQETKVRADLRHHYALVEWFDEHCGELIDYLEENDLRKNTLIVVQSASGFVSGTRKALHAPRSKGSPYEAGVRTPVIYSWPGNIVPGTKDTLVSSIDLVPTVLGAAGVDVKEGSLPGVNLLSSLKGLEEMEPRPIFGESYDQKKGDGKNPEATLLSRWVISGDYKLILHYNGKGTYAGAREALAREPELYQIVADPYEKNNLYASNPKEAMRLRKELEGWYPLKERTELKGE